MHRDIWRTVIVASAALLLTFLVLMFVTLNPTILFGLSAVLWAIADIVRAIHGPDRTGRKRLPKRRDSTTNTAEITESPNGDQDVVPDETAADDDAD